MCVDVRLWLMNEEPFCSFMPFFSPRQPWCEAKWRWECVYAWSRQAIAIAEQLFLWWIHHHHARTIVWKWLSCGVPAIFYSNKSELWTKRASKCIFFLDKTRTAAVKLSHQSPLAPVDKGSNVLYQLIFQFHRKRLYQYQVKNHEDICKGRSGLVGSFLSSATQ